ncbi:MAG: sigma-70 family RNA polymerase sigma factor [Verrucomicrobiaceae bacterium]|nr:sigma-70 family RNA polymerase sigma factor [Verrucomicrobiaceae bacterium]
MVLKGQNLNKQWKSWLSENAPRLLACARQRCQSAEEAEDVLQDALIKLWHYQEEREFRPPDLPLAFSVLRYLGLDHGRGKGRREKRDHKIIQFQQDDDYWLDPAAEDQEEAEILRREVQSLPEKLREVLTLKIWGGLTFAEIAKILNLSNNTAASRYRYALEQLQKKLKHLKNSRHG